MLRRLETASWRVCLGSWVCLAKESSRWIHKGCCWKLGMCLDSSTRFWMKIEIFALFGWLSSFGLWLPGGWRDTLGLCFPSNCFRLSYWAGFLLDNRNLWVCRTSCNVVGGGENLICWKCWGTLSSLSTSVNGAPGAFPARLLPRLQGYPHTRSLWLPRCLLGCLAGWVGREVRRGSLAQRPCHRIIES